MRIGDCKIGDIVWFFNNVCKEPVQIKVLDDCTDGEFLMPRKNVEVIDQNDKFHTWIRELFYNVPCYNTQEEVEEASKTMFNKNHDKTDAIASSIFSSKQAKIECLENFIKEKGLINEYIEFEKRTNYNLEHSLAIDHLIDELKNHGSKQ